ncbi:MAG TPA: ATP-binding protein [Alphaproteobacteria bacterium]
MAPTSQSHEPAIGVLTAEFADRDLERQFRTHVLPDWRQRATLAMFVGAFAFLAFMINDFMRFGPGEMRNTLIALRLGTLAIALGFCAFVRLDRRIEAFPYAVLVAEIGFAVIFCLIAALLPDRVTINAVLMIAMVVAIQLFVPTRPVFAVAAGAVASLAFIATAALTAADPRDIVAITIELITFNIIGIAAVFKMHRLHRQNYAALARERQVNERLESQSRKLTRLARRLAAARDEANHANRAKSEFLAHMSHELRTPLNAINGFSEIIKDEMFGPVAPRYRDYAGDIYRSGMHLTALINDVLDLSKIEAGKLEIEEQEIDPAAVVESSLRLVRDRAHKASLRLCVNVPRGLPSLRADERLLKQMLLNLLTNAIKFTPPGGRIDVAVRITESAGMAFAVHDTGVGIAPHDIPRALEPYGQVATTRKQNPDGTGLGLPLVKKMIELHGGTLELDSIPTFGTVATVTFPASRVVAGDPPTSVPMAKAG